MILRLFGCASGLVRRAVLVAAALAFAGVTIAPAQQPPMLPAPQASAPALPPAEPAAGLDAIRTTIDAIEKNFSTNAQTEGGLVELKRRLTPLRDQLRDRLAELDPRLKQIDQRVAQLGAPPDSPGTEDAAITAERQRLTGQRGDIESTLKQARLLADRTPRRADQSTPSRAVRQPAVRPRCQSVRCRLLE